MAFPPLRFNLGVLCACLLFQCAPDPSNQSPFSFDSVEPANAISPEYMTADDGANLAYYAFVPPSPRAMMVFIHGGGAHSAAGYLNLATELSDRERLAIFLLDLRGHGRSDGERGYVSHRGRIYSDLNQFIALLQQNYSDLPLILSGHSSGAGLLLNYASSSQAKMPHSFLFLAPELGYKSDTARKDRGPGFAEAHTWVFILHAISGKRLCNHCAAVTFQYSPEVRQKEPLLLRSITPEMAHALTPEAPRKQFAALRRPVHIVAGEDDELIDPHLLRKYMPLLQSEVRTESTFRSVPEATHLSILNEIGSIARVPILMAETMNTKVSDKKTKD